MAKLKVSISEYLYPIGLSNVVLPVGGRKPSSRYVVKYDRCASFGGEIIFKASSCAHEASPCDSLTDDSQFHIPHDAPIFPPAISAILLSRRRTFVFTTSCQHMHPPATQLMKAMIRNPLNLRVEKIQGQTTAHYNDHVFQAFLSESIRALVFLSNQLCHPLPRSRCFSRSRWCNIHQQGVGFTWLHSSISCSNIDDVHTVSITRVSHDLDCSHATSRTRPATQLVESEVPLR
jgi:hypothetical protein